MKSKFLEYLDAKGKLKEKPHVAVLADKLEVEPTALTPTAKNKKVKGKHDQVKEYLDGQGKIVERPATEIVPDYKGPNPYSPPKSQGMSEPKPYRVSPNKSAEPSEPGLADKGDKALVYTPDISKGSSADVPGGKAVKTQTEQFLDKTRGMNVQEFTRYMKTQVNPAVNESVRGLIALSENTNAIDKLVSELKRAGKLDSLIESVLSHHESFSSIAKFVKEDTNHTKKLMNAISEIVGPPVGMDDIADDEEDMHDPMGKKKPHDDMGMGDEEEMGDEEAPEGEEDEFADDSEDMEDDGMDFGHGDEEEPSDEEAPPEDEEDPAAGPPPSPNPFLPKKFMGRY